MNDSIINRLFGNEEKYVKEVFEGEFRTSTGATMMKRLETAFAERFESKFAISFINGTATMHAAQAASRAVISCWSSLQHCCLHFI